MQATLSKAAIYTKQPTREWGGDPYLTWGWVNILLRLYESERSNVLLLNMYESLWELYDVLWELLREVLWELRVVEVMWYKLLKCESCVRQSKYSLQVVWGCVRVFYYYSNILCILKTDVWNFSLLLIRQTLHIQNRHKDGHDQSPKNKTRIWPMHTQNSTGQTFLYYYSDKLCIFKIDIKMDMTNHPKTKHRYDQCIPKIVLVRYSLHAQNRQKTWTDQDVRVGSLKI